MSRVAVLLAIAVLGSASTASASLIGDVVGLELHYYDLAPDTTNVGTVFFGVAVVRDGTEFSIPIFSDILGSQGTAEGTLKVVLSGNTITLSQVDSPFLDINPFDLFLTRLNSSIDPIVGITPISEGNVFNLSFTGTSVTIQNHRHPPSNFTNVYQLEFERAAVPEPGTMLLVGAGLVAAGARRRMRNATINS